MKKILTITLLLTIVFGMAVFAGGDKEDDSMKDDKIVFGYASMGDTNAFHALVTQGMKKEFAKHPEYQLIVMDNNWDGQKVVENVEQLIQRGADVIQTGSSDASVFPVLKEMSEESGVPIILTDMNIADFHTFGGDSKIAGGIGGTWLAEQAIEKWGGDCDLYIGLEYPTAGETNELRMKDGFIDHIRKLIDLPDDIIFRVAGNNDIALSMQVTSDIITAHPDAKHILVGCITDDCAQGALAAAQELGYTEDRILICGQGLYDAVSAKNFLGPPNPWGATVAYWPSRYGEFVFNILDAHFKEGKPIPMKWYVEHSLITRDNIREVMEMTGIEVE
jgi:ribose transport system substrate-binding protein